MLEINVLKIKMASLGKVNHGFTINLKKCEKKSDLVKQVNDFQILINQLKVHKEHLE